MEYASSSVIRIAGASQRQLQLWDEQNLVSPRHAGHHRLYTADEVIEVAIVAELRRKGIRLQKARLILNHLRCNLRKRLRDTQTGGRAFAAAVASDLPSVAARIAVELRNQ